MTKQHRWSQKVTEKSNALDLQSGVFTWNNPERIALSLKHSAEQSKRRKAPPYRAGRNLSPERRKILEQAKIELRKLFKI